ncbi:MAG: PIG-L family deacetylase, partial [Candidatus Doudnabacteria bacterium]|nr:PIG-L family deacetylase [Candidatus Doudnabacteria bacterium]
MQKNTKTHLLIIVAHPDDESFLFAGTSLKFRKAGKNVAVICATRGEKGNSKLGKPATEKQLAKIRERELHKACKILGIKSMEFLGYKDGHMINENFGKHVRVIIRKIN